MKKALLGCTIIFSIIVFALISIKPEKGFKGVETINLQGEKFQYEIKYITKKIDSDIKQIHLNIRVFPEGNSSFKIEDNDLVNFWLKKEKAITLFNLGEHVQPKEIFLEDFHGITEFKSIHAIFELKMVKENLVDCNFIDLSDFKEIKKFSINV